VRPRPLTLGTPGDQTAYRLLMLAAVLGPVMIVGCSRAPTRTGESPKEVAEQFYRRETDGRWLSPERWDELQDFVTEVPPWPASGPISVIRNYKVGDARKDIGPKGDVDQVEVDFFEWGSINSFLNFTRARGPRGEIMPADEPVECRTYDNLFLTHRSVIRRLPREEKKTGALRWRLGQVGLQRASVDAALRWVADVRDKSNDPLIKYNAGRTIAILKGLSAGARVPEQPAGTATESSGDTARRFIRLETDLMPGQMINAARFFVETPNPQWEKASIVDIVGTDTYTNGDLAEATVSTNWLGELDTALRLSNYPSIRVPPGAPTASACVGDIKFGFNLLLSQKHWETAQDGTVKELDGPLAWRVEDTTFRPLITLDAAICYVRQARNQTTDRAVKLNAARTLTILGYFKRGQPLPSKLCSKESRGCS